MNGTQQPEVALDFSDNEEAEDSNDHGGDYSTRFEELMSDEEHGSDHAGSDDDEEGFVYNGVDAEQGGSYKDQLRDVLGPDHEEDGSEEEVERSLMQEVEENERFAASLDDEALVRTYLETWY